jgi:hypothetical protein
MIHFAEDQKKAIATIFHLMLEDETCYGPGSKVRQAKAAVINKKICDTAKTHNIVLDNDILKMRNVGNIHPNY